MKKQEFLTALWKQLSDMPNEDVERSLDYYSEMIDDRVESGMSEEDAVAEIGSVEDAAKQIIADAPKRKIRKAEGTGDAQQMGTTTGYTAGRDAYYSTAGSAPEGAGYGGSAGRTTGSSAYSSRNHGEIYREAYAQALDEYTGQTQAAPRKSGGMTVGKLVLLIVLFPLWFPLVITVGALLFSAFVTIWALTFSFFVVAGSFILAGIASAISLIFFIFSGQVAAGFVHFGAGLLLAGIGILMFLVAGGVVRLTAAGSRGIFRAITGIFRRKEAAV
ncbi:MAG: DUF1700 domain-containing protein [Eubacterium sp.]|nr:DUF1700 domain-containing protein [Eubacterium sp.]